MPFVKLRDETRSLTGGEAIARMKSWNISHGRIVLCAYAHCKAFSVTVSAKNAALDNEEQRSKRLYTDSLKPESAQIFRNEHFPTTLRGGGRARCNGRTARTGGRWVLGGDHQLPLHCQRLIDHGPGSGQSGGITWDSTYDVARRPMEAH